MNPETLLAIVVLVGVLLLAGRYIVREKKRGVKCIGCPYADACQTHGGAGDAKDRCSE